MRGFQGDIDAGIMVHGGRPSMIVWRRRKPDAVHTIILRDDHHQPKDLRLDARPLPHLNRSAGVSKSGVFLGRSIFAVHARSLQVLSFAR